MNSLSWIKGLAMVAMMGVSLLGASALKSRPSAIQDPIYKALAKAGQLTDAGEYRQAAAYADLVLNPNVLRVRLDLSGLPEEKRADAERAVRAAAAQWEKALDREVTFRFVTTGRTNVRIQFDDKLRMRGADAAGQIIWSRQVVQIGQDYAAQISADMTLRTLGPAGESMKYENMLHTALHEFGHVMGLEDSPSHGDVMGPQDLRKPVTSLDRHEVEPLRAVRQEAHGIAQMAQIQQATIAIYRN